MKTIMKKLITIKSISLLALALLLVLGTVLQAKKTTPPLTCATEYFFVGHLEPYDLKWVGPVSGDIEGVIKWYLLSKSPHPAPPSQVGQMLFKWEIRDGYGEEAVLLLAGEERERTIVRHGKNSVWRANGIVTEASEDFEDYIGSQTHDGGNFTWTDDDPPAPKEGSGTLRIAGSAEGSK